MIDNVIDCKCNYCVEKNNCIYFNLGKEDNCLVEIEDLIEED